MDPVIEEMLRWRVDQPIRPEVAGRWVRHLRDVVQPQLDELASMKADPLPERKAAKKERA